jgi:hypothetical protein
MRDYSNLAYHSILDWRLGVDLARLALDSAAAIDFFAAHWRGVPLLAIQRLQSVLPGTTITTFAGLPAVVLGPRALWDVRAGNLHPALAAAHAGASAVGLAPGFRSTFMLIRRPL